MQKTNAAIPVLPLAIIRTEDQQVLYDTRKDVKTLKKAYAKKKYYTAEERAAALKIQSIARGNRSRSRSMVFDRAVRGVSVLPVSRAV